MGGGMQQVIRGARLVVRSQPGSELRDDFAEEVRRGLCAAVKSLPCRFFYDEEGSRLFEEITQLPEYYPPAAETEILAERASHIVASVPAGAELVELGSGSGRKTRLLIEAFLASQGELRYLPIDISRAAIEASAHALLEDHPGLAVEAICATYEDGVAALAPEEARARLVIWLGSSVGNFTREQAGAELRRLRAAMRPEDRFLLGVDLRKSRAVLELAYDDPRGVTARFNLNLLARIDRELGGHFAHARFGHVARYVEDEGRIEMYLESLAEQRVRIEGLDLEVRFARGERIHTENSYKYSAREIDALAERGGFVVLERWTDRAGRFCEALLAPRPIRTRAR